MKGKILGSRYKVLEYIAKGGFGRTYLAEDTQLPGKDRCVVKQLYPSIEDEDSNFLTLARRLFKTEASTLHNLGYHEQIPQLLAYFEEEEKFYLVQQYIEGQTLGQELTSGQVWSENKVIEILKDGLNILDFIHNKGVIHRDVKPDNLIRRHCDGKLVLVDFGTVKEVLQGQTNIGQLTVAVGTQGYMPTEQARGKPRPTSDIYALGIIGIQALTGIAPLDLEEDDEGELIWKSLANVSPQLAKILTQMTRYHFKDRYQSAIDVLQDLGNLPSADLPNKPGSFPPSHNSAISNLETPPASSILDNESTIISQFNTTNSQKIQNTVEQSTAYTTPSNKRLDVTRVDPVSGNKPIKPDKIGVKSRNRVIWGLAIALIVIMGGAYFFMYKSNPDQLLKDPTDPNNQPENSTPRINQGEGFRKDL